jgi:hypothetical protein
MFTKTLWTTALLALLAAPLAWAQAKGDHRTEDMRKHTKLGTAHGAAALCLQAPNADRAACQKQLQADCKGLAVGPHCGLKSRPDEHKDLAQLIAEYEQMARIHTTAAHCLSTPKSYSDCQAELRKACGGLGVGKYCGMRHAH